MIKGSEIINIWQKDNLTPKRLLLKSFLFCCLWITANFCYVAALSRANSSAVVAIFSSNYAFVYLLSIYFLKESFHALSLLSLILSIVGILLLSLSSSALPSLLPLLLTLVSSFAAALYKVLLKLLLPSSSLLTTSSFLGFIGILNGLIFWPIWIAFEDVSHFSSFSLLFLPLPSSHHPPPSSDLPPLLPPPPSPPPSSPINSLAKRNSLDIPSLRRRSRSSLQRTN